MRSTAAPRDAWFDLAVDALATYRLTRLVTADIISEPARQAVFRRVASDPPEVDPSRTVQEIVEEMEEPPKLATLVTCRWCAGVWIAAGVATARLVAPRTWDPLARGLALAAAAVLFARLED